jgi:prepilin-type processing-associated H-X9-DG protein
MKEEEVLSGLEKLVESLSIQLRYEKGDFAGGYCVLKDKRMMIVNSALSPAQRIKVLASELAQMNLEEVFVLPALREAIMEGTINQGKAQASFADGHPQNTRSET